MASTIIRTAPWPGFIRLELKGLDADPTDLTDTLPTYTDRNGVSRIAVFDADQNPGWTLMAELSNSVALTAIPSGEAPGETHPEADDPLRFRLTTGPTAQGKFAKGAEKGDIYDVEVYKTNPYPWSLALSNGKSQPLRHIVIQDRTIVEDGEVVLAGLDEALRFVRLESVTTGASLPEGKTYADIVDHITAYYTDGTIQPISALQADAHGNITVTFDEEKVCDGYDIVFAENYEMQADGQVRFHAHTVYRDPEHTRVPDGQTKVTYTNAARTINSYPLDGETKYVYLNAQHSYDMLPSTEHLSVEKLTLCNNGTQTLLGRGGNHIVDYFLYEIDLTGSLLEPEVKTYEDLRIVDLLPDGIRYDSIYLLQGVSGLPLLDSGNAYQPEILENYNNSGRTAVIFHLNAENLQRTLATVKLAKVYFWVQIEQSARPGTVRNEAYKVDQDQASGTISWLQAVNAFGFRTVQTPTVKESNTVWARVCFAGFCVKKVNGATQAALPGAEFTLTDAAGTVVGTAVSDADGRLQFRELTEGAYTLAETKVPDGFLDTHVSVAVTITQNPVTLAYSVTFSGDHTGLGTSADPLCIENHGAYVLPKTGGRGTAAFYVPGAFLLLSAAGSAEAASPSNP